MVASGRVAYLARRAAEYGVLVSGSEEGGSEVEIDMLKVRERKRAIVDSFRGGGERRLKGAGVDVVMGTARFTGPKTVSVALKEGGEKTLSADKIYINVGCRPSRPDIPGLSHIDSSRVLDSTSIQELGEVPAHLVVLGGGNIGLEFAQLFRRLGSKITIVHRGPRLLSRADDPELIDCMHNILREDGIEILTDVTTTSISASTGHHASVQPIQLSITDREKERACIHGSHVLIATGRTPSTESLGLEAAGVKTTSSGHIVANERLETSVEGVYVMGDVKGGPAFTHVSYDDFRIIRDNLSIADAKSEGILKTTKAREPFIPSVVYTDPQLAHVGPKLGSLNTILPKGKKVVTYSMPGSWIARGLETEETRGMLKAVIDPETDKIISFSALSVEGGELMAVVQMAMIGGITWKQLQDGVFAHPSWSESLNNLWGGERKEIVVE